MYYIILLCNALCCPYTLASLATAAFTKSAINSVALLTKSIFICIGRIHIQIYKLLYIFAGGDLADTKYIEYPNNLNLKGVCCR